MVEQFPILSRRVPYRSYTYFSIPCPNYWNMRSLCYISRSLEVAGEGFSSYLGFLGAGIRSATTGNKR